MKSSESETFVVVGAFQRYVPFYDDPTSSRKLGIFKVFGLAGTFEVFPVSELSRKFVLLPYRDVYVAFPQLHSQ